MTVTQNKGVMDTFSRGHGDFRKTFWRFDLGPAAFPGCAGGTMLPKLPRRKCEV